MKNNVNPQQVVQPIKTDIMQNLQASQHICVVGNKLQEFANNKNIFTAKQFFQLVALEKKLHNSKNLYCVHFGQGLNDATLAKINAVFSDSDLQKKFFPKTRSSVIKRASSELTHKRKAKNSMISDPVKKADDNYEAYLMLDENCDEMSDHLTGQHIQGMVLVEAARQMINSISEKYLIGEDNKGKISFILNSIESKFFQYVFPTEVKMQLEMQSLREGRKGNFKAIAKVSFIQNDTNMLDVLLNFSVMSKSFIMTTEGEMAQNSIQQLLIAKGQSEFEVALAS